MKKLLFLTLILISCSATKAQHIFERVTTCQYENSNWGRWVNCSDDIKIKNMASTWGKGTYKIEFYAYNKSQPSVYFLVEYLKIVDGWYLWSISDCSDVFAKAMLNGVNIIFKTSEKAFSYRNLTSMFTSFGIRR